MKYAVVVLDGAADLPIEDLGHRTALEAAQTPNLDFMAANGMVGLANNVPEGLDCSSNVACTSIMGYDPAQYPIGRGAIEGLAAGVDLAPGEVALRLNLCSVVDGKMRSYSADNLSTAEAADYIDLLKETLDSEEICLYKSVGFRGILVVKGHPELADCSYTEAHNITDLDVADKEPTGPGSDLIVQYMRRAAEILESMPKNAERKSLGKLPVNRAWVFWPGFRPDSMRTFKELYGLDAAMQSGVDLLKGLAKLADMDVCEFEGITDGPDTDYAAQGKGAIEMLSNHDVVFVHVEAPDAQGHDGDALGKVESIESIDEQIVGRLLEYSKDNALRIMALPDHPTPVSIKRHTHDMVPFVIWGPGIDHNGASRLTENEGKSTGIIFDPGHALMSRLLAS